MVNWKFGNGGNLESFWFWVLGQNLKVTREKVGGFQGFQVFDLAGNVGSDKK